MTKPFNILEVKARIKTIFRRTAMMQKENTQRVITVRDMQINLNNRSVVIGGREVNLTATEFDLLQLFVTNRGKVFSRENLLETIWKYDYLGDLRTVDVHIRRLREKIERVPSQPRNISSPSGVWAIISQIKTKIKTFLYSIRWKILIAYLLIISIAFSVVAATLIQLVGDYMFNQRVRDDQRVAENLSSIMSEALSSLDANAMLLSALDASSEGVSRVLVLDRYGVVQVDAYSELNGRRFENAEAITVLNGGGADYGFYDTDDTGAIARPAALTSLTGVRAMTGLYAAPNYNDGDLIGVLVYISQAQEIYESLRTLRSQTLLWMLLVAASALIISMFVVRTITQPIGELSAGISRMSRGDLSSRVEVRGKNEFAQLASAFNSMCERLEKLDMSRNQFVSNASHELKTPLSTMKILLETLLYQDTYDPQMQKEFLTDINKEIDRLNRIVSDLLTLVNIDSDGMHLNASELRLRDVVAEQDRALLRSGTRARHRTFLPHPRSLRNCGRQFEAPAGIL